MCEATDLFVSNASDMRLVGKQSDQSFLEAVQKTR
jgi:hypothetical protein